MNKIFKDWQTLIKEKKPGSIWVAANSLGELLGYVDTLEAACEEVRTIASVSSRSDMRKVFLSVSEALAKGG